MAYGAIACAEITVVVQQHHEAGFREGAREWLDPLLLHARVAVRHRNDWSGAIGASRNEQPSPEAIAAFDFGFYIPLLGHIASPCKAARYPRLALRVYAPIWA
jgi:hypothetical protein